MPEQYLNVEEVESALEVAAQTYPHFVERIQLPNETWKRRICHAVKLASSNERGRIGVYFTGGLHAREWVPPDALISFLERVAASYDTNTEIKLSSKHFTADQIRGIVDKLDIFLFPQVNPDGRYYTMSKPTGVNVPQMSCGERTRHQDNPATNAVKGLTSIVTLIFCGTISGVSLPRCFG